MLNELLALLQAGGVHRVDDLARELDTTPGLVELMLEELARLGYLEPLTQPCSAACEGCAMSGLCAAGTGSRGWAVRNREQGDKETGR
jgi:hypothetical protein